MTEYEKTEMAYKNGYAKGYEDGKRDAGEPLRCKDCAWCNKVGDWNYCENPDAPWISVPEFDDVTVADDDFCSYGERRTDA